MANEATLIIETEVPISMTCANGTGIEKGTLLRMTDPFTAVAHGAENQYVAGIAAAEKIANDGVTKVPVYRRGIFKMTLSGSVTTGEALTTATPANYVMSSRIIAMQSGTSILGTALETGTNGETILVELNPHYVQGG